MCACAIVVASVTYAFTRSLGWTVVALLAAGPIGNGIGQVITQPYGAHRPRS